MRTIGLLLAALALLSGQAQAAGIRYSSYSNGAPATDSDSILIDRVTGGVHANLLLGLPDIRANIFSHTPGTDQQIAYNSGGNLITGSPSTIRGILGVAGTTGTPNALSGFDNSGNQSSVTPACGLLVAGGVISPTACPTRVVTAPTDAITSADCGRIVLYENTAGTTVTAPSATAPGTSSGCSFEVDADIGAGAVSVTPIGNNFAGSATFVEPGGTGCAVISNSTEYKAIYGSCSGLGVHAAGIAGQLQFNSGGMLGAFTPTGDIAFNSSTGALTLPAVNTNVGAIGSAGTSLSLTLDAKGRITAAATNALTAPAGTLTGTALASNVVTSSLTSLGTLTSLTDSGNATIAGNITAATWNGNVIGAAYGGAGAVSGLLKATGSGVVSAAVGGIDYASVDAAVSAQAASYTFRLSDDGGYTPITSASATTMTIPPHSSVAFNSGAQLSFGAFGGGTMTIAAGAGVTLRAAGGFTYSSAGGYAISTGWNQWDVFGGK